MEKDYIILFDSTKVYYPVKAAENPYNRKKAYCAGLPQFFGGAADDGEGRLETLQREVWEESLKFFRPNQAGYGVYQATYEDNSRNDVTCNFFCSDDWKQYATLDKWPTYDQWSYYAPKYGEMCWVASAPKIAFKNAVKRDEIAKVLVKEAAAGAPEWAKSMMEKAPTKQFMDSLTLGAFATFVQVWTSG